ncbi:MAG: type I-B CRISPR-associated protein Cas7/Cst2/DevR [Nitrososphaerales archaeon]
MTKVVQISVLGKVSGNVNADEVIGNRITLKKMYSSDGEVLPFISARAIKYAIRQAFRERGFDIDPLYTEPRATEQLPLSDSGRPDLYIDNDLFGYMVTRGERAAFRRHAPIAISYFKALKDTPIKSEFAARFPREFGEKSNPVPFEVEVAEFIGRLNTIIYDYVGDFNKSTLLLEDVKEKILKPEERRKRLSSFLEIFLMPSYVLPKRTNSLNILEYYVALCCMSDLGPVPIYQYLNYNFSDGKVNLDTGQLKALCERKEIKKKIDGGNLKLYLIDYENITHGNEAIPKEIKKVSIDDFIEEACKFLIS